MEHQIRGMDQTAGQGIWTRYKALACRKLLQTRIYQQSQILYVHVCLSLSAECSRFCLTSRLPCCEYCSASVLPSLLLPALQLCHFFLSSPVILHLCLYFSVKPWFFSLCLLCVGMREGSFWSVYGEISPFSIVCPLLFIFIIIVAEVGMYLTGWI